MLTNVKDDISINHYTTNSRNLRATFLIARILINFLIQALKII